MIDLHPGEWPHEHDGGKISFDSFFGTPLVLKQSTENANDSNIVADNPIANFFRKFAEVHNRECSSCGRTECRCVDREDCCGLGDRTTGC